MEMPVRRIITGHDSRGTAIVASDDILVPVDPTTAPVFSPPGPESAFGVVQIHRSRTFPVDNQRRLVEPHKTLVPLADTKGPSCRIIDVPPTGQGWLHRTLSLDYAVVLKGEVYVQVDGKEEKRCQEHDVVVMRGTSHAWINRGPDVARIFCVVVPSRNIVTAEGEVLEKTEAGEVFDPQEEDD